MIGSKLNGFVHPLTLAALLLPCSQYVNWMKAGYFFSGGIFISCFQMLSSGKAGNCPKDKGVSLTDCLKRYCAPEYLTGKDRRHGWDGQGMSHHRMLSYFWLLHDGCLAAESSTSGWGLLGRMPAISMSQQEQYYCERCKRKIDCEKRILFKDCCCREWYGLGPQVQVLSTCTIHCQKARWANITLLFKFGMPRHVSQVSAPWRNCEYHLEEIVKRTYP